MTAALVLIPAARQITGLYSINVDFYCALCISVVAIYTGTCTIDTAYKYFYCVSL